MNCCFKFGFCGATVLVGSSGLLMSFNTTFGGVWCCPFKGHARVRDARVWPYIFFIL